MAQIVPQKSVSVYEYFPFIWPYNAHPVLFKNPTMSRGVRPLVGNRNSEVPPIAADLIHECGKLPLALSMVLVGAMLHGKAPRLLEIAKGLQDRTNSDCPYQNWQVRNRSH